MIVFFISIKISTLILSEIIVCDARVFFNNCTKRTAYRFFLNIVLVKNLVSKKFVTFIYS